jgi:molybdate transport system substrate-binding protein
MRTVRSLFAAALLTGTWVGTSAADELKVFSAIAFRPALQELGPAFEASSGHKLKIEYATAGAIQEKIAKEEEADVAILSKPLADKLVSSAKLVSGTAQTVARAEIGAAVKKGAAKPDISSVDALKQALLKAKSISHGDPASGGAHSVLAANILEKLGIAAEVKAKTHLYKPPAGGAAPTADTMLPGGAELGLGPISVFMEAQGVDIIGPLPAELQTADLDFTAGSTMQSDNPVAAKQLIDFLRGPKAAEVYKAKGMRAG